MASLRDIRIKIKTIKNIQKITKAMKMVAAARLKRSELKLQATRPYARKIAEVTLDLAALTKWQFLPSFQPRPQTKKVLVLVFTGDRGLAGGFHQQIADGARRFGKKFEPEAEVFYYLIGQKGEQRFRSKQWPIFKSYTETVAAATNSLVREFATEILNYYLQEEFDQIYLYYAKYYSSISQRPRAFQLLPIDPSKARKVEKRGLFIFEPDQQTILEKIIPRYLESEIKRAFMETEVGELGARMTAMASATDNAGDLIDFYQLRYNRIRQSKITTEIAEIVGGAEALETN